MRTLNISDEVKQAQNRGVAVVALESTIISHGMPFPHNVATAERVEAQVRACGAVPATIAILDGIPCIGLDSSQLHKLGKLGLQARKCSRRDLAFVLANKLNGSTTVAATMFLAHKAGIEVFVTGGIGGVHRGVEHSMDISADLTELGRTPVTVVCAGVKSILDIPRTLEYLETEGVPVMTFRSEKFPAFFTSDSGELSPLSVQSAEEAARVIASSRALGLQNGAIVAVPVPEHQAAQYDQVESASCTAIQEAERKGVSGRDLTPFLLQRINDLTGGESLKSNIALILNNARVGASIAISLQSLRHGIAPQPKVNSTGRVIVVGGASQDIIASCPNRLVLSTSNIGHVHRSFGGVGRNIAECIARLGVPVKLVSVVGDDDVATNVLAHAKDAGIDVSDVIECIGYSTSSYIGLHGSDGDLGVSVADFRVLELLNSADSDIFKRALESVRTSLHNSSCASMLVLDANLRTDAMVAFSNIAYRSSTPVWIETISIEKASRLAKTLPHLDRIDFISPNEDELIAIGATLSALSSPQICSLAATIEEFRGENDAQKKKNLKESGQMVLNLTSVSHLVCTRGHLGLMLMERIEGVSGAMKCTDIEASMLEPEYVVNTNGAGDSLVGGCVAALASGYSLHDALKFASTVAAATVASRLSVADTLVPLKHGARL